jgi:hypothetical protein
MLSFPFDSPFKFPNSFKKLLAGIFRRKTHFAVINLSINPINNNTVIYRLSIKAPMMKTASRNASTFYLGDGECDSISYNNSHDGLALVTIKSGPVKVVLEVRNLDATSGEAVAPSNLSLDGCDLPLENLDGKAGFASVVLVILATDNRAVILAVLTAMLSAAVTDMNADLVGKGFALLGGKDLRHNISLSFKCWLSCLLLEE